ncbi:MAG: hypothetical protein HOB38_09735 [Deltaproteobacteria bacterium]|nr:hypothetical protein [Deltaproteobacteria bacterium]
MEKSFLDADTNSNSDNAIPPNPLVEKATETRDKILAKTFYRVKTFIEKIVNARKARRTITSGLNLIKNKLYKRASIEFQNAMVLNEDVAMAMLDEEFNALDMQSDPQAMLAIGLILLKKRPEDFALSNTLGNYARKMEEYKQANDLYRKSLRIKKSYIKAFYNLAASMGRVDKYDFDIKASVEKYIKSDDFILPEYQINPKIIDEITTDLRLKKKTEKENRIKKMTAEKEKKEAEHETYEVKRLVKTLERLAKVSIEPTYEEIKASLQKRVSKTRYKQSTPEEIAEYHGEYFNLGLYAYIENDPETALECFLDLQAQKCAIEHVNMMVALVTQIKTDAKEAIALMFDLLSKDRFNRYLNVNLGLLYKRAGNRLLAAKYLAVGASFLEKSEGLYRIPDMIRVADENNEEGKLGRAIKLYHIVATESDNLECWLKIGNIYQKTEKPSEAVKAFKEILKFEKDSEEANTKLMELHDMYCQKAEDVFQNRKFSQAAAFYERALGAMRLPKTIERTIAVYKQLSNAERVEELVDELDNIHEQEKEIEQEKLRLEYIAKGKMYMKRKAFEMAINSYEKAFRMKVDKEVMMSLAHIYKGMNRDLDVSSLMHRWAKMNRYEEEIQRKRKEKERFAMTVDDDDVVVE